MSTQQIELTLEPRKKIGKGLNALRESGLVPAVIHNHGGESVLVTGNYRQLQIAYNTAGLNQTLNVKVGSKNYLTLIRDIDLDPTKHTIRHVVFQSIKQNEEIETEVPIVFAEADIPAEKKSLLVLKELETLHIKALPKDLPEKIEVNLSSLENAGDIYRVESFKAPAGVTVLNSPDTPIAVVETPRDQIAEADASAASLAENADKPTAEETPAEEPSTEDKPAE